MQRERCGSSGVAAAADGSSGAKPAGDDQSERRACVRAGVLVWRAHLYGASPVRSMRADGRLILKTDVFFRGPRWCSVYILEKP